MKATCNICGRLDAVCSVPRRVQAVKPAGCLEALQGCFHKNRDFSRALVVPHRPHHRFPGTTEVAELLAEISKKAVVGRCTVNYVVLEGVCVVNHPTCVGNTSELVITEVSWARGVPVKSPHCVCRRYSIPRPGGLEVCWHQRERQRMSLPSSWVSCRASARHWTARPAMGVSPMMLRRFI